MFPDRLIVPEELGVEEDAGGATAVTFRVRLPWYRALPMDGLHLSDVAFDGRPVASDRLDVEIDGTWRPYEDVAGLRDAWWFVLDPLRVRVRGLEPVADGEHKVTATVGARVPYIVLGTEALVIKETLTRALPLNARSAA
ncbi:C-glycoside deglycosidase beta subunit domain-containing protein [Streptomyces cylindrosporus]|uniref:C-deglycosylation enzyme beta subunit n=1 Tax=Streptomyces cylindrosporus TaxID=2927583 RepID=A0ABS9Y0L2_9ACTN|nr:DUF6379 domain-containing protein [Streptomyces cylindrosporus]MCI3270754.1 DUF6379 domain-containing protein [Streptomyces cylindrosporus]